MLIGLSGYAQAGKDSLGAALVKNHGFTRYAFADALKEMAYRLNPIIDKDHRGYIRLKEVVDVQGWEEAKENPEVRRLLQVMGTEAGRELLGENIWVDTVLNKVGGDNVVITDCRFPNEAMAVRLRNGFIVRIERPGVGAANDHDSETSLDDWPFDVTVTNGRSVQALDQVANFLVETFETASKGLRLF